MIVDAGVARGAELYVAQEMFGAGPELVIVPDVGDEIRVRLERDSHLAIVDDKPGPKLGHPVRYVLVDDRGVFRTIDHEWLPTVSGVHCGIDARWDVRGHRVYGPTDVEEPFPRVRLAGAVPAPAQAAAAERKIALVIDGGHRQHEWRDPFARKLDEDSRAVASALEDLGHDVRRSGGYRGSVVPAARVEDVRRELARIAGQVSAGDEVILFPNRHGTRAGEFVLQAREGGHELLACADLARSLDGIPAAVPVRILVDACFSGTAVEHLSRRNSTIVSTAKDATREAPGGLDGRPTFTAAFGAAARDKATDLDGDGRVSVDETFAVASRAFRPLGSRLVTTGGAPRVPGAETTTTAGTGPPASVPQPPLRPDPSSRSRRGHSSANWTSC